MGVLSGAVSLLLGVMPAAAQRDLREIPNTDPAAEQATFQLAPGLEVEARAPDGLVEGVRMAGRKFVVGAQWHPEWKANDNPFSRALFGAFGEACRAAAGTKEHGR